ncbi:MAG: hypothetical protein RTU30_09100 [Candidatus Thorarchaeota archaeon]
MAMRIKRTVDIAMSNYEGIIGSCVFSYEGRVAYATENMQIAKDIPVILATRQHGEQFLSIKGIQFIVAQSDKEGMVAINPDGALSFICGTGKGVWFVAAFAPMDADKNGILKECVQAAKNIESSVSIFDL